jgi:hypothetical protein
VGLRRQKKTTKACGGGESTCHTNTQKHTHIYTCTHMREHLCTLSCRLIRHTHTHARSQVCTHTFSLIHSLTHSFVHTHTHTHTRTHGQKKRYTHA